MSNDDKRPLTGFQPSILDQMEALLVDSNMTVDECINITGNLFARVCINREVANGCKSAKRIRRMMYQMIDIIVDHNKSMIER